MEKYTLIGKPPELATGKAAENYKLNIQHCLILNIEFVKQTREILKGGLIMYRIVSLNPYNAEMEGIFCTPYSTENEAISAMMDMIEACKTYPYNEPYLYAVYENNTVTPVLVGGYSADIAFPIPEFKSCWCTVYNHCIEQYGKDADFVYHKCYTVEW